MLKAAVIGIFCAVVLISFGCNNLASSENKHPVKDVPEAEPVGTVDVQKSVEERQLKDVVWKRGEFSLKFPCEISAIDPRYEKIAASTTEETENCESGILYYTVSSKKSRKSLKGEFEKFMTEKGISQTNDEGLVYAESLSTKLTQNGIAPNQETVSFEATRSRLYKISDNWLIKLEARCHSQEKSVCEKEISFKTGSKTDEFFDSLKINK